LSVISGNAIKDGETSLFTYKGEDAPGLVQDARELMLYSYHGLENVLGNGLEAEANARNRIEAEGRSVVTPEQLGLAGAVVDRNGTFQGETDKFRTAQADVLAKYDEGGNLTQVGLAIRGTSGTIDNIVSDTIGDVIDYLEFLSYEPNYAVEAFGQLLEAIAAFMQSAGLTAEDLIVTGHSLGGGAVTNLAGQSDTIVDGFLVDANFVGCASHYVAEVLSFDFENDPVPSVISEDGLHRFGNDTD